MRSNRLIAHDGDTLEGLIWREAKLGPPALPAVFAANLGICERQILAAGDVVNLPPDIFARATPAQTQNRVQLWD